jgi:hypothetical protein
LLVNPIAITTSQRKRFTVTQRFAQPKRECEPEPFCFAKRFSKQLFKRQLR